MSNLNRLTDRCDSCRAQAFVRVGKVDSENLSVLDLLFCSHHFVKFEAKLEEQGFEVLEDEREYVNRAPSISANSI